MKKEKLVKSVENDFIIWGSFWWQNRCVLDAGLLFPSSCGTSIGRTFLVQEKASIDKEQKLFKTEDLLLFRKKIGKFWEISLFLV
jgi:hypothetical protein